MVVLFYGSMLAVIIVVNNMVSILKKVKNDEDTSGNTISICFSLMFILYSVFMVCGK